jgi:tRNA A37 methylthiotransferase MiaB
MKDSIPQKEKERRSSELMELQQNISLVNNLKRVGQTLKVIVDSVDNDEIVGEQNTIHPKLTRRYC